MSTTRENNYKGEDAQFDESKFNTAVLDVIEQQKAENPGIFMYSWLTPNEPALLLHILLETHFKNCWMSRKACEDYLEQHGSLVLKLCQAYATRKFSEVINDLAEMRLKPVQDVSPGLSPSNSIHGLQSAFEQPYKGDTAQLFIETLERERGSYGGEGSAERPYNWSIAVVQSSGMGKSRMVEEASKTVFTIPINLREVLSTGKLTYPPSDDVLRQYFEISKDKSDEQQQKDYKVLLWALFTEVKNLVQKLFPGLSRKNLANAWAEYLKAGQSEEQVGQNRQGLYEAVVTKAKEEDSQNQNDVDKLLQESCQALVRLVQTRGAPCRNSFFVYFDEAHSLTKEVAEPRQGHERSPYHNLGTVLATLIDEPVFFTFLSTNSRLEGFAPPPSHYPSERVSQGAKLIPPFTELPFDLFEDEVLRAVGPLTLKNLSRTEVLVGMGRILWYARYKHNPEKNVFRFAVDKLSASSLAKHQENAYLAALGVRVGIEFDQTHPASYPTQSRLVESHLRVAFSIPEHRTYMHTGSPSEPILAEAASRFLNKSRSKGIQVEGPERLSQALKKGFLARGERGEIVGRLLVTCAHDLALGKNLDLESPDAQYHRPIRVTDFLCALFHATHHDLILGALPLTERETTPLSEAFADSYVFFSHFALAADSEMLSTPSLVTALVRGMAIQAMDGQASVDAVIPIHMDTPSRSSPILSTRTSAINLQFKNRKEAVDCFVDRTITVSDVTTPVISIVFEFGVAKQSNPVMISSQTPRITRGLKNKLHHDDRHYQIVAYGCNPAVFGVIPSSAQEQYNVMLGGKGISEDFPRYEYEANKMAMLALRPALSGKQQHKRYDELLRTQSEEDITK